MPNKSPEEKAVEKSIKATRKIAMETARREQASQVVQGARFVNGFRIMDLDSEAVLMSILESYDGNDKNRVSLNEAMLPKHSMYSLVFQTEKLKQYGVLVEYMPYGNCIILTLSEEGKAYFQNKEKAERGECEMQNERTPMILISHSTNDQDYATALVTLFEQIGLSSRQMVCSSVPGYDIPIDEDIYDWLAGKFVDMDLYVIFVLSDRYYSSAPCLNEMGAAWVTKKDYTSILLPGFSFSKIRGAINPNKIAIKLDSEDELLKNRLNELRDKITAKFGIDKIPDVRWEKFRTEFMNVVKGLEKAQEEKHIRTNQPSFAVAIEAIDKQLPGTAEVLDGNFTSIAKHKNLQISIEIINQKPARSLIVFDKLLTVALKPGEKVFLAVAYEDSEDVKHWPSRVKKILHSDYDETDGLPNWFNICYQDEEGHNMVQSFKLQAFEDQKYYDVDGYPWEA